MGFAGTTALNPGTPVTIGANPSEGFVFGRFSGTVSSRENPITVTVTEDITIFAEFLADEGDEDEDGLTNDEEIGVWDTDPYLTDTNLDGIPDGLAVDRGLDPSMDFSAVIDIVRERPDDFGILTVEAVESILGEVGVEGLVLRASETDGDPSVELRFDILSGAELGDLSIVDTFSDTFSVNDSAIRFFRVSVSPVSAPE